MSGLRATADSTSFAPRATTSLRVTISGTNISTSVDGSGQFTLNGVPPGTVTLQFSGPGVSANITLSGVTAGEEIHIEVTLTNSGARVDSETRHRDDDNDDDDDDDDDDLPEVEGVVAAKTGACPALTFTIGDRTVRTTDATRFEDGCERIQNGVRVEAKGPIGTDRVMTATRVELDD